MIHRLEHVTMYIMLLFLSNLLDISIIAFFIYSLLLFLRRTRSYMVFVGLAVVVGLYALAKTLQLHLTLLALQYFVGASVVVFAIVFQTELRKYFELLGVIGSQQLKSRKLVAKSSEITEIIQACVKMAHEKTGALIVLQGKDPLDMHLEGGVILNGVISEEVILSMFDPHSEGHDGALIISNNLIYKFGTHLPLSTNFKEIGKRGTRHSAALGLSEETDALCIVVSEEKGTISVCRGGYLKTLKEYSDLEKALSTYIQSRADTRSSNIVAHIVKHNFWLKIVGLFGALLVWLLSSH